MWIATLCYLIDEFAHQSNIRPREGVSLSLLRREKSIFSFGLPFLFLSIKKRKSNNPNNNKRAFAFRKGSFVILYYFILFYRPNLGASAFAVASSVFSTDSSSYLSCFS